MKSSFALLLTMGALQSVGAALEGTPTPGNVPGADYPRIGPDLRVMFRLRSEIILRFAPHDGRAPERWRRPRGDADPGQCSRRRLSAHRPRPARDVSPPI